MIKFTKDQTKTEIHRKLVEYYDNKSVISGLPTITYSEGSLVANTTMLNNLGKLSKLIYYALSADKAKHKNWHAVLDIATNGITALGFTASGESKIPELLNMPVIGSC